VARNQAAGLPTDYSSLSMPRETRDYVPKLQALKNIVANPEPFGIALGAIPNQPYFATVTKLRDIDVQLAARLAEMPVADFMALNPGFSRPIIRASLTPRIVLPADKVEVFHDNLEALGNKSLVTWKTYHPGKGENFESIAKKHGMSVGYLKEVNGIPPRQRQLPRLLVVPTNPAAAARLPIMYSPPIPVATRRIFHTVKKGETLASIAGKHQVSVEDLKRWNGISKAVPGRTLAVEVRGAAAKPRPRARG
jgi:membrane-bound lytic murein transglycosylase D